VVYTQADSLGGSIWLGLEFDVCNCLVAVAIQYGAQLRENLRLTLKCDDSSSASDNGTPPDNTVSRVLQANQRDFVVMARHVIPRIVVVVIIVIITFI